MKKHGEVLLEGYAHRGVQGWVSAVEDACGQQKCINGSSMAYTTRGDGSKRRVEAGIQVRLEYNDEVHIFWISAARGVGPAGDNQEFVVSW